MRRAWAVALLGLLLLIGSAVAAVLPVPQLAARVTDQTGTLDASQQQALESALLAFERSKGSQIAVLVVPTTGDETIDQYSIRVVDQWKLGRKGVDDGALLLVAKNDHKVRIEVGKGLEGVIPDAIANRIIDEAIVPRFKAGDFAGGLNEGVARLIGLVNGEPLPPPKPQRDYDSGTNGDTPFMLGLFAFFVLRAVFSGLTPAKRGSLTGGIVSVVALLGGAVFGYALALGALAFLFALPTASGSGGRFAGTGGWGGWGGGGGGWGGGSSGGGGFSGGGGGFSGGGASGGW